MTRVLPTTPRVLFSTFVLAAALVLTAIRCGRDVELGTAPPPDGGTDAAELDGAGR